MDKARKERMSVTNPVLQVSDLKKSYRAPDGTTSLIIDVPAFELAPGQQVALQGGSGSGKTTFLNLIAGILQADSGRIVIDGQEMSALSEPDRDRLRAHLIGYVFQTFNLLQGLTALENVALGMAFGPGVDMKRAQELLERVELGNRLDYKPRQLSVGQQQRVAVARALASRPRLVLADEPTGNLDRRHALEALELIRNICREDGAALLLVSHDPEILNAFEDRRDLASINRAMTAVPVPDAPHTVEQEVNA